MADGVRAGDGGRGGKLHAGSRDGSQGSRTSVARSFRAFVVALSASPALSPLRATVAGSAPGSGCAAREPLVSRGPLSGPEPPTEPDKGHTEHDGLEGQPCKGKYETEACAKDQEP